jgi:serine/threonine-protein kinase
VWVVGGVAIAAIATAAIVVPRLRQASPSSPSASASASSAAPVATAITELPPPKTTSAEAAREFAAAMQATRDAAYNTATDHLQRTLELDPNCAAAHLALARGANPTPDARRTHLAKAVELRSQLDDRDTALLEEAQRVAEARLDYEGTWQRWKALADRFPLDAEIVMMSGTFALQAGHTDEGNARLDRALAMDPKFALAEAIRGMFQKDAADLDGALASANRCLAISANATACLELRAGIERSLGQCDKLEADARKDVALDPDGAEGYLLLAAALLARNAPIESIVEATHRARDRMVDLQSKALRKVTDPLDFAVFSGDFAAAIAAFPDADRYAATATSESFTSDIAQDEIQILEESGETDRALAVADAYMKRLPALTPDEAFVPRPWILMLRHRSGKLSDDQFHATRGQWAKEAMTKLPADRANEVWFNFFALSATNAQDAREALDALPSYEPLPPYAGNVFSERVMGQALFFAGRVDEAIPHFERAVTVCTDPNFIASRMIASELLGEARESKGDKDGACAAYAEVLARWGNAKPRSRTADAARAHATKLGCPKASK